MQAADTLFWLVALATIVGVPAYAWRVRGRRYATFALVILTIALPGALVMHGRILTWLTPALRPAVDVLFVYLVAAAGLHLAGLVRARMRHPIFRVGVSAPGQAFIAAGALSGIWLLVLLPIRAAFHAAGWGDLLALLRWLDLVPILVVALSLVTSTRLVPELVRVQLADDGPDDITRLPVERYRRTRRRRRARPLEERPLRIVQITDPHLGPWQPIEKLRQRISRLIDEEPDLVLLTGDFLTMEGQGTPGALRRALEPLRRAPGRCFAIFGNHDHEAPGEVRAALEANDVQLLLDAEALAETPVGSVQIVGADWAGSEAASRIPALLERLPRREDHLRLFLLHDPLGFQHVPKGDVDLTLSGHTHGGQLGLVSFRLDWTVLSRSPWPDHGLFGNGSNRLYVHRGTGFYGFPLRIGVPGEASVLELVLS